MKHFSSFRLDTVNQCLWRGEDRVSLAPKAFDVLRYLVEHADRLVTQDEILEALWPETYVNPEVIKKYILGIRKVLGDRHDKPGFIETFPRRGYQFVAPVSEVGAGAPADLGSNAARKMVGREAALTRLDSYLGQALKSQRQVIFITGEAGVGKTTLVDAFHQAATRRPNLRVIRGQCVEGFGGKEAYYPVLEAVGQLLREAEGGPLVQALVRRAPTWLIQFPSLLKAEQHEALQKEILGATRERMVREICEALESITAENPLVLILEDLHWVDPSTLDLISALARRRGPAKLVLLGTYRPADVVVSQSPLKGLKQDLLVHHLCEEVVLERLEESDIGEYLAAEFADGSLPAGLANLIYRHSGGNALFMVAIVQDMVKQGLIAQRQGSWALTKPLEHLAPGVPETLQEMLEVQFGQLSTAEQDILKSASVAGERFSVWAISTTLDSESTRIEDLCEELAERQQFIKTAGIHELANGEVSAHYEFIHSLYRDVLYRRVSEVNRSKLHRSLGERLRTLCTAGHLELAAELAMHFEKGHTYQDAIQYLILAAQSAARRFAYRDSIQVLRHALELVPKVAFGNRIELEIQILERIGDTHYVLGNMADSAQAYEKAASQAAQGSLPAIQVNALICLARPLGLIDPERAIAAVEQAALISAPLDDPLLQAHAQILAAGTRLYYDTWRSQDAEICASANQTIRRLSGSGAPHYPEMHYALIQPLQGDYYETLKTAEAGILKMNDTTSPVSYLFALVAKVVALMHLGQFGEALEVVRTARERAEKNGNDPRLLNLREAWLRTFALDFEGARRVCETILRTDTRYPAGQPEAISRLATAYSALEHANYDEAVGNFKQILDKEVKPKFFLHWYWRMQAQLGLCNVWLASGNLGNARGEADRFLESALSTADPNLQALAWEVNARVAIVEKDWTSAEEYVQKGLAILAKFEIPMAAWRVHATAWDLYRLSKNDKAAQTHRKRAEAHILTLVNSLPTDEPLRNSLLAAVPIRRILSEKA
jgi:DNA-binding winged helix-turn-helix (wHTH) protein/tetratricopeptide (TPR) repeat protein